MSRHLLKNTLRLLRKHSSFSILNILGLTLGISSCLLIILYLNFELDFDKFHEKGEDIYRVVMKQPGNLVRGSSSDWWVVSPAILKPTWESELPEVDQITRTMARSFTLRHQDDYFEEQVLIADPEFLDIFTFPLLAGSKAEALNTPYSILLTQSMAKKYFGEENPIGQTFELRSGEMLTVTGVLQDIPANSHLQFNFLVSFSTLEALSGRSLISQNWLNNSYRTYLTLPPSADLEQFDQKLRKYDLDGFNGQRWSFHIQPLYDIHFNRDIGGTGDWGSLYIFFSVGLFILFIACFNYVNLYIAHYRKRSKNISIQKIIGASRIQLMRQFLSESFILVVVSLLLSLVLVVLAVPLFNKLIGQELNFSAFWNGKMLLKILGLVLFMAFLAGSYPAVYLSKLQLINGIKGGLEKFSKANRLFRRSIVVAQFSLSILLIVGTLTVLKQLKFTASKSLGYQKENIIYLPNDGLISFTDGKMDSKIPALKEELLRHANITAAAASSGIPSRIGWSNIPVWEGQGVEEKPFFYRMMVDFDFLELYGIDVKQGRTFSKESGTDDGTAYILNQAAVNHIGWNDPLGSQFGFDDSLGVVVGISKDFHFESLHKPITPIGIGVKDEHPFNYISLKVKGEDFPATIAFVEEVWSRFVPQRSFKYNFFDEQLERMYVKDQRLSESLTYFSLIALCISCLGIFGIISFTIKERTKEIGIRKILGAPFAHLFQLLSWDLLLILFLAILIGGASGWYFSGQWLNNFAYRFDRSLDIVFIAALVTTLVTVLPVSFKLIQSIQSNPVEALREE